MKQIFILTLLCLFQGDWCFLNKNNLTKRVLSDPYDPRNLYNFVYSYHQVRRNPRYAFFPEPEFSRRSNDFDGVPVSLSSVKEKEKQNYRQKSKKPRTKNAP